MMTQFITYIISSAATLVGGVVTWETIKYLTPILKQHYKARKDAKNVLYDNLDPILKSAGELYGKIESLAKEDFATFVNQKNSISADPTLNRQYVLYLFSQFWAQIEYLRLESHYINLSKIKKGKELLKFIDTIESRKYRVLDRSLQRIIGECLIADKDQKFRVITLKDFIEGLEDENSSIKKWISHLEGKLLSVNDKEERQRILRFGVIVASLIDHFDPKHKTVRRREIYLNKLNPRSKQILHSSLFRDYLNFTINKTRYYQ